MNHSPADLVPTGARALIVSGSPFVPGKPLTAQQPLFGRDDVLRDLANGLRSAQFGSFNLVGERRIGKTSLLNHLEGHADQHLPAAPGQPSFVVVRLNLQGDLKSEARFYGALLSGVIKRIPALAAEFPPRAEASAAECQQLLQRVNTLRTAKVVVLVDEFECVFEPSSTAYAQPGFCNNLRTLCGDNHLALVLATRQPLKDYFDQQKMTSTLLSYLTPLQLGELSPAAADALLTQPSDNPLDNRQVRLARQWADTHPCRLQCAGDALYWSQVQSETDAQAKDRYERNAANLCFVNPAHLSVTSPRGLWHRLKHPQWLNKMAWLPKAITWCEEHWKLLLTIFVIGLLLTGRVSVQKVFDKLVDTYFSAEEEKDKKAKP